jgi:pantoate--beta-alanine ligase
MQSVESVADLRSALHAWRLRDERIAFVPTMGNLHEGHFSLVTLARTHADRVVVSSFVNPTQFGPNEDYARYPRTPDRDRDGLVAAGCDLLFFPQVAEMYPFGIDACVQIHVPGITDELDGEFRPGHFDGVATVVTRLFNAVQPDVVVLGSKDYQQLQTIRYLVRDLAMPIEIVAAPTRREPDGLAMSSRNQYLSAEERARAPLIHETLQRMRRELAAGAALEQVEFEAMSFLQANGFVVDYVEIRRASDLKRPELLDITHARIRQIEAKAMQRLRDPSRPVESQPLEWVALVAARLGTTRLIDNLEFGLSGLE